MSELHPASIKTLDDLAREWDMAAHKRVEQILSGRDLSYDLVLTPCILQLTEKSDFSMILDVGCGVGCLSSKLSELASYVVGVDLSKESIEVAKNCYSEYKNIEFVHSSIEDYALSNKADTFSLAIANMTLMDTISLDNVLASISKILKPEGHFIFTITHPCYWPYYWGYANEEWYDYKKEIIIEGSFNISLNDTDDFMTTHIHRPLENYINSLVKWGFEIDKIIEPMPEKEVERKYPKPWEFPRFLGARCVLKKDSTY